MIEKDSLELYELFCKLMDRAGEDNAQKVVIYQPHLFVEMAREILQLREENFRLNIDQVKFAEQVQWNLRLVDQLRYVKRRLDEMGIRIDVSWR
jgi:hypothetical protein